MRVFLVFLFSFLNSSMGLAQSREICKLPQFKYVEDFQNPNPEGFEIHTISAWVKGEEIPIKFGKHRATATPKKGTVVFLGGGPANPWMGKRPENIPPDYDVVTLDYLGLGINRNIRNDERMSMEGQGEAVTRIVQSLGAQDVYLYGSSFGTTVATTAAYFLSHLPADRKSGLKGVVLEGVQGPGHIQDRGNDLFNESQSSWLSLTESQKNDFKVEYKKLKNTLSPSEMQLVNEAIEQSIVRGRETTRSMLLNFNAKNILNNVRTNGTGMLPGVGMAVSPFGTPVGVLMEQSRRDTQNIYRAAGCQGFSALRPAPRLAQQTHLFDGTVPSKPPILGPTECQCATVDRVYHPGSFPIKNIPLVYINGTDDPYTPIQGARAHFKTQKHSPRVLIAPRGGGHGEMLLDNGRLHGCAGLILQKLGEGDIRFLGEKREQIAANGCRGASGSGGSRSSLQNQ